MKCITLQELYEWRDKLLTTFEKATEEQEKANDYKMKLYYEEMGKVSIFQLNLLDRLIEQAENKEK
jgi:hypothetical protein